MTTPAGAVDSHMHFYGDAWPIASTTVLRPPAATVADYREVQKHIGTTRTVVVQPSTYGLDNRCQLAAMAELGADARGVMVVDATTPVDELHRHDAHGVVGARFHMLPGGAVGWQDLEPVAERIAPLGWHIQLQLNGRELPQHLDRLRRLPCPVVIDHVGRYMPPVAPDHEAFVALLALLETGRCWVKLSAPYEADASAAPDYDEVTELIAELVARHPDRLVWASNWPHPGQADPPTPEELVRLRDTWLPTAELRSQVLVANPTALYAF